MSASTITLINVGESAALLKFELPLENIELASIASYLRARHEDVDLLDLALTCRKHDSLGALLSFHNSRLAVVHTYYSTLALALEVVKIIARQDPRPLIALCGQAATLSYDTLLAREQAVDVIILGEGEEATDELANLSDRDALPSIQGIAYRDNYGNILRTATRPAIAELDSLPVPARDSIRSAIALHGTARVLSSRGCGGSCTFCPMWLYRQANHGQAWRARSARNVVDEIEQLVRDQGVTRIEFADQDFIGLGTTGKQRAAEIAYLLLERELGIEFEIYTRADNIEPDLFLLLREAGLSEVTVGFESANAATLERYSKRTTLEQNRQAAQTLSSLGIQINTGFLMFDPYTRLESIRDNLTFLIEHNLLIHLRPNKVYLIPRSRLLSRSLSDDLMRSDVTLMGGYIQDYRFFYATTSLLYDAWHEWYQLVDQRYGGIVTRLDVLSYLGRFKKFATTIPKEVLNDFQRLLARLKHLELDFVQRSIRILNNGDNTLHISAAIEKASEDLAEILHSTDALIAKHTIVAQTLGDYLGE